MIPLVSGAWLSEPDSIVVMSIVALCLLLSVSSLVSFFPVLLSSCFDKRPSIRIEHSISKARSRNILSACMLPAFIATCDRYSVWAPAWLSFWPAGISVLMPLAAVAAVLLWRRIVFGFCPAQVERDVRVASVRTVNNILPVLVVVMAVTVALMMIFGSTDGSVSSVLRVEILIALALNIRIEAKILFSAGLSFSTFLYLCALESVLIVFFI